MNSQPLFRLKRAKQNRYNPLPNLTDPSTLTRKLDAFEVGYLKEAVNIWDSLEQRDDLVRAVVSSAKRFWSPVEGGGKFRVFEQQVSAKMIVLTVEYYSNVLLTSSVGLRKLTIR